MKYELEQLMKKNMDIRKKPSEELNQRILDNSREVYHMDRKKKCFRYLPRVAAAALAVVVATGGIALAAENLWNRDVAEEFGVAGDREAMESLKEQGFAQIPQDDVRQDGIASVTDKGIKVTVLQTLADERCAYVYYEVDYGDKYHIKDKEVTEISDTGVPMPTFPFFKSESDQKEIDLDYSGGVSKIKDDHTVTYESFISLSDMDKKDTLSGKTIKMNIREFIVDREKCDPKPEVIAKDGNWNLSWEMSAGAAKRVYHLNREVSIGKYHFTVRDVEITPLSCNLTYEGPEGRSLSEYAGIIKETGDDEVETDEKGNMKVRRYLYTGGMEHEDEIMEGLPKNETLFLLDGVSIFRKDGEFNGMGGMSSVTENSIFDQFDRVLDVENVTGIRVAGRYISLDGCTYETVEAK